VAVPVREDDAARVHERILRNVKQLRVVSEPYTACSRQSGTGVNTMRVKSLLNIGAHVPESPWRPWKPQSVRHAQGSTGLSNCTATFVLSGTFHVVVDRARPQYAGPSEDGENEVVNG